MNIGYKISQHIIFETIQSLNNTLDCFLKLPCETVFFLTSIYRISVLLRQFKTIFFFQPISVFFSHRAWSLLYGVSCVTQVAF